VWVANTKMLHRIATQVSVIKLKATVVKKRNRVWVGVEVGVEHRDKKITDTELGVKLNNCTVQCLHLFLIWWSEIYGSCSDYLYTYSQVQYLERLNCTILYCTSMFSVLPFISCI
jgi:hypothetical protein